jgi:hypothetical protein
MPLTQQVLEIIALHVAAFGIAFILGLTLLFA